MEVCYVSKILKEKTTNTNLLPSILVSKPPKINHLTEVSISVSCGNTGGALWFKRYASQPCGFGFDLIACQVKQIIKAISTGD